MSNTLFASLNLVVRPYKPEDRTAVQEIFLMTAYNGHPSINFIDDGGWLFDAMVSYYVTFEPDCCYVAELNGQVVGYLTGAKDTQTYQKVWVRKILPRLLWKFFTLGLFLQGRVWGFLVNTLRSWVRGEFDLPTKSFYYYPAHFHINLRPLYQNKGIGSQLVSTFLTQLKSQKVNGVYVRTCRPDPSHPFFEKLNFFLYAKQDFTLWEYLESRPYYLLTYAVLLQELPTLAVNHV